MRVYVEHDMTVNHNTSIVTLKAGQIVEGPLAIYLVESDCAVTIEQDDRPSAAVEAAPVETGGEGGEQSHTPGGGEQSGAETSGDEQAAAEPAEGAEPAAEPGAAE